MKKTSFNSLKSLFIILVVVSITTSIAFCAAPVASDGYIETPVRTAVSIDLIASDDGLPTPPAALTYIIETRPQYGTLYEEGVGIIDANDYPLSAGVSSVTYTPDSNFLGVDSFTFIADDTETQSNSATVSMNVYYAIYKADMDTDPNWVLDNGWEWGVPQGLGSFNGDPTSGYTGTNVIGYNLAGDYQNNLSPKYATLGPVNAIGKENLKLSFYRWLGVERSNYDHADIHISNDGTNWQKIWENDFSSSTDDSSWQYIEFSLDPAVVDDQPEVYIRWVMGLTDGSETHPGWNIDDVMIEADMIYDLSGDFIVNLEDFAFLAAQWQNTECASDPNCLAVDFTGDAEITQADLQKMVGCWLD